MSPRRTRQRLGVELSRRTILPYLGPAACEDIELGDLGRTCGICNRPFANTGETRKNFIIGIRAQSGRNLRIEALCLCNVPDRMDVV